MTPRLNTPLLLLHLTQSYIVAPDDLAAPNTSSSVTASVHTQLTADILREYNTRMDTYRIYRAASVALHDRIGQVVYAWPRSPPLRDGRVSGGNRYQDNRDCGLPITVILKIAQFNYDAYHPSLEDACSLLPHATDKILESRSTNLSESEQHDAYLERALKLAPLPSDTASDDPRIHVLQKSAAARILHLTVMYHLFYLPQHLGSRATSTYMTSTLMIYRHSSRTFPMHCVSI